MRVLQAVLPARLRTALVRAGLAATAIALIFGLWNLAILVFGLKPYALPTPQSAIQADIDHWSILSSLTLQTVEETAYGFLIGAAIGFLLGVLMSTSTLVQRLIYPTLITSQAVPIVAIAAPLAILFGFGMLPKLVIVAWVVFFPVVVSVLDGLAHIDPDLIRLSRVMGATRVRGFVAIRLPATLSPLFSGLKIGATYAVTGAVIGEWMASAQQGLGTYLQTANASLDTQGVFGATILLTAIGVASFLLVVVAEAVATPWRTRSTARPSLRSLLARRGRRHSLGAPGSDSRRRDGRRPPAASSVSAVLPSDTFPYGSTDAERSTPVRRPDSEEVPS